MKLHLFFHLVCDGSFTQQMMKKLVVMMSLNGRRRMDFSRGGHTGQIDARQFWVLTRGFNPMLLEAAIDFAQEKHLTRHFLTRVNDASNIKVNVPVWPPLQRQNVTPVSQNSR